MLQDVAKMVGVISSEDLIQFYASARPLDGARDIMFSVCTYMPRRWHFLTGLLTSSC